MIRSWQPRAETFLQQLSEKNLKGRIKWENTTHVSEPFVGWTALYHSKIILAIVLI
jgi:hypothetical protein